MVNMPLSPALAAWLVDQGHDAVHATDLGLHLAPDSEIVARAKHEARTIITADLDYPRLLAVARSLEPSLILSATATGPKLRCETDLQVSCPA
ncbi:DUF5615 family PIN-like protein [Bradyrhizobium sp. WSM 1738]|nr:DUF5615 family PIN-like protein [Bradyrhizobium hereditatis]